VKVKISAYMKFRALIGESLSFELSGDRVMLKDFLRELSNRYGKNFDDLVFEPQSRNVKRAVLILINGQSYMNLKYGLSAELRDGDEIQLLPILAGG
jgi:MoaD family protein